MNGFGNTSGFSTTFGASPFREKLTGYEDIYGEQLGQPALNNLKAPEIEAYKNALTDSPDFEPFMQQRKRVLDLATKAVGAGMNIQNPRTEDEVQYALLFNQEVEKYNQLGRQLEEQRKFYEKGGELIEKGYVVDPANRDWTLGGLQRSSIKTPDFNEVRQMFPSREYGTQEGADEHNVLRQQVAANLMKQYGLTPEEAAKRPEFAQRVEREVAAAAEGLGYGFSDPLEQYKAITARISANKPSGGGGGSTQPDFDNVIDEFVQLASSNDANDVLNAYNYVNTQKGFGKLKVNQLVRGIEGTPSAQYKEVEINLPYTVPMQSGGSATGVFATNSQVLARKLKNGEYFHRNGVILDKAGNQVPLSEGVYFKMVSKDEIGQDFYVAADVYNKTKKTPFGAQQISTKYRTEEAESVNKPDGRIPMERNPTPNNNTNTTVKGGNIR